jgi:hypothetical protein
MASILRATMRARTGGSGTTTGIFVPETVTRIFPGTDEMTVVAVARLRVGGATSAIAIDPFIMRDGPSVGPINAGGWEFAYDRISTADPEVYLGMVDGLGAFHFGEGRGMVAADEGKVHRFIGVGAVAGSAVGGVDGLVAMYVNGVVGSSSPGFDSTLPSFTPSPTTGGAPDSVGVLGLTDQSSGIEGGGMTQFDVMDIAVLDRALDATEVAALDALIKVRGGVPDDFAQWVHIMHAERLLYHDKVIDAGGLSAGRGWPVVAGVAPILGSVVIAPSDWGT